MPTPPLGTQAMRTDPTRVLEEIKRLALEQLGRLPGDLYEPIDEALAAAARKADDARTPQVLYQNQAALWVLRQHHAAHLMRFRQQVAQGFDDFRAASARGNEDTPLGLVDEEQIDFHLAGQSLASALDKQFAAALETMTRRLRAVAFVLGVEQGPNPLGPTRLATAFVETFNDEQVPEILRGLLFRHYEQELERVLGDLYAQVNTLLGRAGYGLAEVDEPTGRRPSRGADRGGGGFDGSVGGSGSGARAGHGDEQGFGGAGVGDEGGAGGGGYGGYAGSHAGSMPGAAGAGGLDGGRQGGPAGGSWSDGRTPSPEEMGELRELLHAWRAGGLAREDAPADATAPKPPRRRELRVEEVFSVVSLLQAEPADAFARALAGSGSLAAVIRDQLNDGSRRLGLDPDQTRLSLHEEDAIDLVALLFDSLFHNQQLQDRARRLYARLVLPYVKVALTDQRMFVQPEHPARRLFDAITEAVAGNRGETPQERELLDRAAAVSQRVVAEYNEDVAIFETAHAELDSLLRQQRRRVELQAERAAKATFGRERLAHARSQADAVLARRLAAPPLTAPVSEFLATTWRHHLVQSLLREGAEGAGYLDAVKLGDRLVEADRIAAEGRGHDLALHLLQLEPQIRACLASSGLDDRAAEHGMAVLVKGLAYPGSPRDLHGSPPEEVADEDAAEKRLWLAGGTDTLRFDPADAEWLRELPKDTWLELVDMNGETTAAKVAWISPLTSRRLLVNRRGFRVLVASVEELAVLATAGRLRQGVEPTAFEQAMQHLRQQLDKRVPRGTPD